MKTTLEQKENEFKPVTISVTFETRDELQQWLNLRGDLNWISDYEAQKFVSQMFPSTTTYFEVKYERS